MDVVVEPGIGWMELNQYLEPYGLFFPLDPGPGATIGGMCATCCSGSLAVRYGTMRDNVISLKVVLANGDIVKAVLVLGKALLGLLSFLLQSNLSLLLFLALALSLSLSLSRSLSFPGSVLSIAFFFWLMKLSTHGLNSEVIYDLTHPIIGSEGTLGVVTEVTLRLQKIPKHSVVAMCYFPTIGCRRCCYCHYVVWYREAYSCEQTQIVQRIFSEHNGSDFVFAEDPQTKKELWKIRKEALWACFAVEPNFEAVISVSSNREISLNRSKVINLIFKNKCIAIAQSSDGSSLFVVHTDLSMEGTCTGEHGVGTGKMKYLEKELGIEV
ncbi:hypothetical protein DITRI_Ditri12bG0122400 [Diplodiscus trichospermus]